MCHNETSDLFVFVDGRLPHILLLSFPRPSPSLPALRRHSGARATLRVKTAKKCCRVLHGKATFICSPWLTTLPSSCGWVSCCCFFIQFGEAVRRGGGTGGGGG